MPTLHLDHLDLHYERGGDGPRLLFLNGSGATLATTGPVLDPFRAGFDLVAHDQRGLGRTSAPPEPWSMADYAADAVALLDHLGWTSCRVVGVSFGGMVAQELAVTHPERIERLALLCTSPGGDGGSSYPLHELPALPPEERRAIATRILDDRFTPEWLTSHDLDRALAELMAARDDVPRSAEEARGLAAQMEARRGHDVWDRLPRISCPTLVAAGRHDGIAPPSNAEAIASRVAGAELRLYDGGHLFFFQDPAAFPDVAGFLAES